MAVSGNTTLVEIGGTVVGSQRGVSFSENRDMIDITSKTADGTPANSEFLAGRYSATATMSSLYITGDAGFNLLETAMRSGGVVTLMRQEGAELATPADYESALAFVTSLSSDFPADGPAEAEVSFQITDGWTAV